MMSRTEIAHIVSCAAFMVFAARPATAQSSYTPLETSRPNTSVEAVAADQQSLDVRGGKKDSGCTDTSKELDHLVVSDATLRAGIKNLKKGDCVSLTYTVENKQKVLKVFSIDQTSFSNGVPVLVALGAGAIICMLFYYVLSGLHPMRLILGEDNRYSNSKFQMALWFAVLITTYIAAVLLRTMAIGFDFFGGVGIPTNLLELSGLSAITFGIAKGITTGKVNDANLRGIADPKNSAAAHPNLLRDLTHDDGVPATAGNPGRPSMLDLGDFQMVVVTVLAVAVYLGIAYNFLGSMPKTMQVSLPDVDSTILATFGLGQGAYLTKKAVGNVGQS